MGGRAGQVREVEEELLQQLSETGFLLAPIGNPMVQQFTKIVRVGPEEFRSLDLGEVVFGPVESDISREMERKAGPPMIPQSARSIFDFLDEIRMRGLDEEEEDVSTFWTPPEAKVFHFRRPR